MGILRQIGQYLYIVKKDYENLFNLLQGSGNASANAAHEIQKFLVS